MSVESCRKTFFQRHSMIPVLTILCGMSGFAQGDAPLTLGEFLVYVSNSSNNLYISVDASGTVGGSRCDWYPVTHAYDHRDTTWLSLALEQLDRSGCPGYTGDQYFAYGAYTVTIENNSIVMDYRDADYQDGSGNAGTGYSSADLYVWYNHADGKFYKNSALTQQISGCIAIWEDGRKSSGPRIPVTVRNSFSGGEVTVSGNNYSSPCQVKWSVGTSYTIAAISPHTENGLISTFSSWSDGGAQSHSVTASLDSFSSVYTANFIVSKPVQVSGVDVGAIWVHQSM